MPDMYDLYNKGLTGVIYDEQKANEFLSSLPHPFFKDVNTLFGDGKGKLSLPWKALEKFAPTFGTDEAQQQGDCVSMGTRTAVDITRAYEILYNGEKESFVARGATEPIYGYRGHGGEGMFGHQAAEFVAKTGGFLVRKNYSEIGVDLSKYNPKLGAGWGRSGVPKPVISLANKNKVKQVSLVLTVEEALDLLANGYGLAVCSNMGFSNKRDKFGISEQQGTWHHCYTDQTLIYSPDGYKSIKDYKIGDRVFDHLGSIQKVLNTFSRMYSGDMIRISSWGIPSFEVTPDHPILISREVSKFEYSDQETLSNGGILVIKKNKLKTKYRTLQWVPAKTIKIGDWLVTPKVKYETQNFQGLNYGYIPKQCLNKPKQLAEPDNDIAWMFGFYIGDGNTVRNHKVCFTFSSKETAIADRLKVAFGKLGLKITFKSFGTYIRAYCYSAVLARCFDEWFGVHSTKRQIPEFLISQGWDINSIIDGIYSADGFVSKNSKKISMSNKGLILQLRSLLINMGKSPSVFRQKRGNTSYPNGGDCYTISTSDMLMYKTKWHEGNFYNPVRSVDVEKREYTVYNLEVSESHTYIADGVASHNCMASIGADDTRKRSNETLFLFQQSWGKWNSGPLVDQPEGSFWIREKVMADMLSQKQTYAFADFDGFKRRMDWSRIKEIYK